MVVFVSLYLSAATCLALASLPFSFIWQHAGKIHAFPGLGILAGAWMLLNIGVTEVFVSGLWQKTIVLGSILKWMLPVPFLLGLLSGFRTPRGFGLAATDPAQSKTGRVKWVWPVLALSIFLVCFADSISLMTLLVTGLHYNFGNGILAVFS